VSGVLAVVVLGAVLSSEKTSISPEVERFLHRWTHVSMNLKHFFTIIRLFCKAWILLYYLIAAYELFDYVFQVKAYLYSLYRMYCISLNCCSQWSLLAFVSNTLIFILVGIVITELALREISDSNSYTSKDWFYIFVLYLGITVIRLVLLYSYINFFVEIL